MMLLLYESIPQNEVQENQTAITTIEGDNSRILLYVDLRPSLPW